MKIEKILIGNRYHSYPSDIESWQYNEEWFKNVRFFNVLDKDLIEEPNYSNMIEDIWYEKEENEKLRSIMINMPEIITHQVLYDWFNIIKNSSVPASSYRNINVAINGNYPPAFWDVKNYMDKFLEFHNNKMISIEKRAILGHLFFELIHPFEDGNGRIGRLLLYHVSKMPFSEMLYCNRELYYEIMDSKKDINIEKWIELMAHVVNLCHEKTASFEKAAFQFHKSVDIIFDENFNSKIFDENFTMHDLMYLQDEVYITMKKFWKKQEIIYENKRLSSSLKDATTNSDS